MKTLNLAYPEKSDIKYRVDKFPDGQQQVVILDPVPDRTGEKTEHYIRGTNRRYLIIPQIVPVQIKTRLNTFTDLELIICATKSLKNLGVKEIHLYTPYFMGARSDRQFESGSNNYLKDVICPIINSLEFDSVTVLDPHSDVLEACLNNFRKESNINLVYFTMNQLRPLGIADDYILVSPDAGASKKIYKIAEQIGYKGDIITCSKDRDNDGKLTKTIVPVKDTGPLCKKDYIIIDDICDGGATFINIAKELKKLYNCNKIYLIVTHGIFSKGFEELSKYFDGIYCTNSYKDIQPLDLHNFRPFLKQLNVF